MKIIALVKHVPDTYEERHLDLETGRVDRDSADTVVDEINERALEVALQYKDRHKDAEVVVLVAAPAGAEKAIRKLLSMGADSAILVSDDRLAGADAVRTSLVLAEAVTRAGFDLLVFGNESTDGGGGIVPAMVAERLGLPLLSSLSEVTVEGAGVSGTRSTENGSMTVSAPYPAAISVTERSAEARFPSFKGILAAKKKPLRTESLDDLGINPASAFANGAETVVISTARRPARNGGTKILDEGDGGRQLAEFLTANRLI